MFNRSLWSHLMTRWSPIAVVLGVFLVASCGRKPTSTIVLDKPEATLSHTFQQVSNVVELPDGRLAMADVKARSFLFLNPSNGEVQELGEHADTIWPPDSLPAGTRFQGSCCGFPPIPSPWWISARSGPRSGPSRVNHLV